MSKQTSHTAVNSQSLLRAIRQRESTIARKLAAAHDSTEKSLAEAQERAYTIVAAAADRGRLEGEAARQGAFDEIEQEAKTIIVRAREEAETFLNISDDVLETTVNRVVNIVIGTNG
ncbi:MAG: hypothetical protein WAM60_22990 [Candidatus Promineifilaceae bacterium]